MEDDRLILKAFDELLHFPRGMAVMVVANREDDEMLVL